MMNYITIRLQLYAKYLCACVCEKDQSKICLYIIFKKIKKN